MKKTKLLVMLVLILSCLFISNCFADVILPRPEENAKIRFVESKHGTLDVDKDAVDFSWIYNFTVIELEIHQIFFL